MRSDATRIFLLSLILLLSSVAVSVWGAPDLQFEQKLHDFGELNQGEKVVYHFKFKNAGDELLKIEKVASTCGCAAALATTDELEPGESGEIKVTFKSAGYVGAVSKWISVHTNDPDEPAVRLRISCIVVVDILVRPASLNLGKVQIGESASAQLTLLPMKLDELEVKKVETSSDHLTYEVSDYTENQKNGLQIEVILDGEMQLGKFSEVLRIQTNSMTQPLISVSVMGQVRGDIWATPEEIAFGCHRGKADTLEITVSKGSREGFLIVKVDDNIGYVNSTVHLVQEESTHQIYRVILSVDPDAPTGFVEKNLDLFVADEKEPVVRLPMYVFIH